MKSHGATDGYSLLEMLVVLAIISLVSGVIFTGAGRHRETLDTLSRQIGSVAQEASLQSMAHAEVKQVIVDVVGLTVTAAGEQSEIAIPPEFKLTLLTGTRLIDNPSTGTIEFFDDGTSSGGEITVEDEAGNFRTVRIHWLTGAVTVSQGARP